MYYLIYASITFHVLALFHHGSLAMYAGVTYFLQITDPLMSEVINAAPFLLSVWNMVS